HSFFHRAPATPAIHTLPLHDALPIYPCGEQPLPPYGSCLLGSVNLSTFVRRPFTEHAHFDWEAYRRVVAIFTRMLDNVVEINGLDRKSTRLNSSHVKISYAVFCLKKK